VSRARGHKAAGLGGARGGRLVEEGSAPPRLRAQGARPRPRSPAAAPLPSPLPDTLCRPGPHLAGLGPGDELRLLERALAGAKGGGRRGQRGGPVGGPARHRGRPPRHHDDGCLRRLAPPAALLPPRARAGARWAPPKAHLHDVAAAGLGLRRVAQLAELCQPARLLRAQQVRLEGEEGRGAVQRARAGRGRGEGGGGGAPQRVARTAEPAPGAGRRGRRPPARDRRGTAGTQCDRRPAGRRAPRAVGRLDPRPASPATRWSQIPTCPASPRLPLRVAAAAGRAAAPRCRGPPLLPVARAPRRCCTAWRASAWCASAGWCGWWWWGGEGETAVARGGAGLACDACAVGPSSVPARPIEAARRTAKRRGRRVRGERAQAVVAFITIGARRARGLGTATAKVKRRPPHALTHVAGAQRIRPRPAATLHTHRLNGACSAAPAGRRARPRVLPARAAAAEAGARVGTGCGSALPERPAPASADRAGGGRAAAGAPGRTASGRPPAPPAERAPARQRAGTTAGGRPPPARCAPSRPARACESQNLGPSRGLRQPVPRDARRVAIAERARQPPGATQARPRGRQGTLQVRSGVVPGRAPAGGPPSSQARLTSPRGRGTPGGARGRVGEGRAGRPGPRALSRRTGWGRGRGRRRRRARARLARARLAPRWRGPATAAPCAAPRARSRPRARPGAARARCLCPRAHAAGRMRPRATMRARRRRNRSPPPGAAGRLNLPRATPVPLPQAAWRRAL
jgi:hypothetical protein